VDYTGWYDNGDTFDASSISFTVGRQEVIPGFEKAVIGMTVGESKVVAIPPAEAYGEHNPALIKPVNMSVFVEADIIPVAGMTVNTMDGPVKVDSIDTVKDIVYLDYNHPMAGKTLHFNITLKSINK
jgi:FKBP-type peptidyl-prolyl cis-trans isomerase 2